MFRFLLKRYFDSTHYVKNVMPLQKMIRDTMKITFWPKNLFGLKIF